MDETLPPTERVLREHVAAENAHDLRATLATLHPDCLFVDATLGVRFEGRAGAERYYRHWWDAFGLVFARGEDDRGHWTRDGLYVATGRFRGVHAGPFLGIAPTGREVDFGFVVFVEFRDGLMSGERFHWDLHGLLAQLGRGATLDLRGYR